MKTAYVMVGMPATGKSTFVNSLGNVFVYSTDAYIQDIANMMNSTYDEMFEKHIRSATSTMNQRLDDELKQGGDIVWDQTNLGAKKREKILRRLKQHGYQTHCVYFKAPDESEVKDYSEWKRRLEYRSKHEGKSIPDHIMISMMNSISVPAAEEGWDSVTIKDIWNVEIH